MTIFEQIAAHAESEGVDFLLIGGYAVIGHGFPRFTVDVDLLIEQSQIGIWHPWLARLGYTIFYQHPNFLQLRAPEGLPPVDLMLVDADTFAKLWATAVRVPVGGASLPAPSVQNLIALKLHATKSRGPENLEKDWTDILHLIKQHELSLSDPDFRATVERYGGRPAIEKIERVLSGKHPLR